MPPIKTITLCSGYDSQILAMRRVKQWHPQFSYQLVAWSEIDPRAITAHNIIHPDAAHLNLGDVTKVDWHQVKAERGCDLLFYSPPCTSVSIAGKQAGMAKGTDAASALVWHIERAIDILRPKYLIYENVKNVLSARHRQDFIQWVRTLESYGYESHYQVVDAAKYGVPQHRERVFMVSMLGGGKYTFPTPMSTHRCINDILEPVGSVPESYYIDDEKVIAMQSKMRPKDVEYCRSQSLLGFTRDSKGEVVNYHPKDIANTVTCSTGKGRNTDMFVISPRLRRVGNIAKPMQKVTDPEEGRVYASSGVSPTIKASRNQTLILTPPPYPPHRRLRRILRRTGRSHLPPSRPIPNHRHQHRRQPHAQDRTIPTLLGSQTDTPRSLPRPRRRRFKHRSTARCHRRQRQTSIISDLALFPRWQFHSRSTAGIHNREPILCSRSPSPAHPLRLTPSHPHHPPSREAPLCHALPSHGHIKNITNRHRPLLLYLPIMTINHILTHSRRPDITIRVGGRIDIAARIVRILALRPGDVIDLSLDSYGTLALYVKIKAAHRPVHRHSIPSRPFTRHPTRHIPLQLHRPGQEHPVIVHRLLAKGTIDARMVAAMDGKQGVQQAMMDAVKALREEYGE